MECYICCKLIERHEYTRHVGSHSPDSVMGIHSHPGPQLLTLNYDTDDCDHQYTVFPAQSTPPRLRARTPPEHAHPLRAAPPNNSPRSSGVGVSLVQPVPADNRREARCTPSRSPYHISPNHPTQQEIPGRQSNAFQTWLCNYNYAHDSQEYTMIDGQKSDSELQVFMEAAQILRGTTRDEVVRIVKEFIGFPCSDNRKTCLELVRKTPIFPGLVAYTYTHLVACPQRGWLGWVYNEDWSDRVSELKELVERWTKYDDIWCILSCDKIKEGLLKLLRATKVGPEEHECNSALLNGTTVLDCDILNLAAKAALCINGPRKMDILSQRGIQAGKLIELFHDLLESNVRLEKCYQRRFFSVLVALSKESGCRPRGIDITEGAIDSLVWMNQGGFGYVSKGKLGAHSVAVKALKRDNMDLPSYTKRVCKEAVVWRYLRHPNCLPLYGVYTMPMEGQTITIALVSPWMDQGTLVDYLKRNPTANRTELILDVVRGLTYLHTMEPHVAHRDIKPENILITRKGHACLADFGLASIFDMDDHLHTVASKVEMGGTYHYMAPEILKAINETADRSKAIREVNKRLCDMYALGCTIYAAYTGGPPFDRVPISQLLANIMSGRRPEFPVGKVPCDMWSFIENLWAQKAVKRLTAKEALDWMEVKASSDGVDSSIQGPLGLEEEWEWRNQPDDKSLWSVSF